MSVQRKRVDLPDNLGYVEMRAAVDLVGMPKDVRDGLFAIADALNEFERIVKARGGLAGSEQGGGTDG